MALLPHILLVDDDAAVRASLAFSLELEGFGLETSCAEDLAARTAFSDMGASYWTIVFRAWTAWRC